ncbi:MAG: adenylyl-sulfate kinase [Alphaproteobacteria bacterium]|nr:MAG: adenylyl-sulfate kinase [Alphaproteobacteria bacterium]
MGDGGTTPLLRFIACGSVDDGKSTLIGRLLHDCGEVPDDQLAALESDSRRFGTQGSAVDFALLLDGLSAEREQGITIDVAYRYFATAKRRFIVADAPGHEQYTRNMATGASTAELAVILVDATKGVLPQTRRHSAIVALMGIRHVVLAVNKMDLVDWSEAQFQKIEADYRGVAGEMAVTAIPVSALGGDNVAARSAAAPWYDGPSLVEHLEAAEIAPTSGAFRMPVQLVARPNRDFRGFQGLIVSGQVAPGEEVVVLPSGRRTRISEGRGEAGQSVTLTLADQVDCSRGDVIASAEAPPEVADQFEATIVWLAEEEMLPGRQYLLRIGADSARATLAQPKYRIDVESGEHLAARTFGLNDIGIANLSTDKPIVFEPYEKSRDLGGFILVDRTSNATVAAGMIRFALRRSANVQWQAIDVTREARSELLGQRPKLIWFTGLSGAGKSTIANLVEKRLHAMGRNTFLLDGDNLRHGLNRDLGFTDADRVENIRRAGEVAKLMTEAGLIVLAAFISPFRAERDMVRRMLPQGDFIEVHVDVPLAEAERRDPKGLYAKARAGELPNFTGIDSAYEPPEAPELRIDTAVTPAEEAAEAIVRFLLSTQG